MRRYDKKQNILEANLRLESIHDNEFISNYDYQRMLIESCDELGIKYDNGVILESKGVISKSGAGYSHVGGGYSKIGGVNRIKKANRWADFSKQQVKDGIDLGSYGYDAYKKATNPVGHALKSAISGGAAKKQSAWITFVKTYAQENNMPYKEALKAASGPNKQMKSGGGYSSAN